MSKNKKSWGFIKREYRGCFENVYFHGFTNADYKCKLGCLQTRIGY